MYHKAIDEEEHMILLDQGLDAFQNNINMTDQESFGAIGTLTRVPVILNRARDAKIPP